MCFTEHEQHTEADIFQQGTEAKNMHLDLYCKYTC